MNFLLIIDWLRIFSKAVRKKILGKRELRKWLGQYSEKLLGQVGIESGQTVLDFACGEGNYTITVARIVGQQGIVYAIDKDNKRLNKLKGYAESIDLKNIRILNTSDNLIIGLENESIDVVLLYDVLHYYYFPKERDRRQLLREIYRVLKPDGFLSLYPTHLDLNKKPDLDDVKKEIEDSNLHEEKEYSNLRMFHDGLIEDGKIINFKR